MGPTYAIMWKVAVRTQNDIRGKIWVEEDSPFDAEAAAKGTDLVGGSNDVIVDALAYEMVIERK